MEEDHECGQQTVEGRRRLLVVICFIYEGGQFKETTGGWLCHICGDRGLDEAIYGRTRVVGWESKEWKVLESFGRPARAFFDIHGHGRRRLVQRLIKPEPPWIALRNSSCRLSRKHKARGERNYLKSSGGFGPPLLSKVFGCLTSLCRGGCCKSTRPETSTRSQTCPSTIVVTRKIGSPTRMQC